MPYSPAALHLPPDGSPHAPPRPHRTDRTRIGPEAPPAVPRRDPASVATPEHRQTVLPRHREGHVVGWRIALAPACVQAREHLVPMARARAGNDLEELRRHRDRARTGLQ